MILTTCHSQCHSHMSKTKSSKGGPLIRNFLKQAINESGKYNNKSAVNSKS